MQFSVIFGDFSVLISCGKLRYLAIVWNFWRLCIRLYKLKPKDIVIEQWMAASRLRLNMDKTELMWTGTKYNVSKIPICCHSLTLGGAQVVGSDAVCVLGVL